MMPVTLVKVQKCCLEERSHMMHGMDLCKGGLEGSRKMVWIWMYGMKWEDPCGPRKTRGDPGTVRRSQGDLHRCLRKQVSAHQNAKAVRCWPAENNVFRSRWIFTGRLEWSQDSSPLSSEDVCPSFTDISQSQGSFRSTWQSRVPWK